MLSIISTINRFIIGCSRSWWKTLLLFAGQTACLLTLLQLEKGFPAVAAGNVPFDMQNNLTVPQIFEQVSGYTDQAFSDYYLFQAVDFMFPLLGGLLMASVFTFGLRHAAPDWYRFATGKNLLVLLLAATLFDYLENLNFLWVINALPDEALLAAQLGILAKKAKLACMNIVFVMTGILLLVALARRVARRTNKNTD